MDFDPSTPPKKHNVFLPIILSFVLVLGIWVGYFLSKRINSGSSMSQNYHGATNDKINSLLDYIEYQYVDTINKKFS